MLGSLMEDKRLDFDAPLLSVRRFSGSGTAAESTAAAAASNGVRRSPLPTYMSELKSGPVRNPGVVPFVWEQRPGQPKDGPGAAAAAAAAARPPAAPRPPPAKLGSSVRTRRHPPLAPPTPPPDAEAATASPEPPESSAHKKDGDGDGDGDSGGDDDDDDDVFSDARDTLSRTESFFMNCSMSGLSGMPHSSSDPPRESFAKDPLARDFMMGRFLPAAQAVASGSPQYTFRKAANPKQPERVVTRDHRRRPPVPLPFQHTPNYNSNLHGCGFLPKFCLKSSLCLLNPVPALKVRGRPPPPPHARRSAGPSIRSSHNATLSQAGDEHSWEAVYKHKLGQKYQSRGEDGRSKLTNDSNQLTYWSDSQTADGSSPFHRSTGEGSPLRNEARESPFHEGKGLLGVPNRDRKSSKGDCSDLCEKDGEDCWDTTPQNSSQQGSGSGSMSPAAEKGVEVDSVDVPDADPKVRIESGEKDVEIEEVSRKIKESSIIEARNRDERGLPTTLAVSDPGEINGRETFKCNKLVMVHSSLKEKISSKRTLNPCNPFFRFRCPNHLRSPGFLAPCFCFIKETTCTHRQTRFAEVLAKPTSLNSEF
uniref:Uncharacterized protein n=1 Tax=Ananas comosus var. bracteatus TaxID=296719 RepID=A0A6V7NYX1_ANACO|nr:unnamed protein product [Ananas comosus var. bracteatus]